MEAWLSRRVSCWSIRLFAYWPARKGTAYSLSLHSVRMCSAVLRYPGRLHRTAINKFDQLRLRTGTLSIRTSKCVSVRSSFKPSSDCKGSMQKRKLKPAESALNQTRNWNRGALETSCGKVIVGFGPGAAVEHAPAGQQDEVIKALADVTARLVDGQHNLRQPILTFFRSGPKLLHLLCIPQSIQECWPVHTGKET